MVLELDGTSKWQSCVLFEYVQSVRYRGFLLLLFFFTCFVRLLCSWKLILTLLPKVAGQHGPKSLFVQHGDEKLPPLRSCS